MKGRSIRGLRIFSCLHSRNPSGYCQQRRKVLLPRKYRGRDCVTHAVSKDEGFGDALRLDLADSSR